MPSLYKKVREACFSGDFDQFSSLVKMINIDFTSRKGWGLIHFVVSIPKPEKPMECEGEYASRIKIMKILVERGINTNRHDDRGRTPLHVAAENGFVSGIKLLIETGASVDAKTPSGVTPVLLACRYERYSAVKVLLEYGAVVEQAFLPEIGCSAIHYIANSGDVPTMRLLLKHGGLVNASLPKFNQIVPFENFYIDSSDEEENLSITPLHLASQKKHVKMVKCLLEYGAKATLKHHNGLYDLHYMASVGDTEIIRLLADKGALINAKSPALTTPLFYACLNGKYDNVALLLELGADPSQRDVNKALPLAYAVIGGNVKIVKLFLELGFALENFEDESIIPGKCSPITVAAFYGRKELFIFFQENGFPVNYKESDGSMPIHFAARQGCLDMCEYLLALGIDINCQNSELKTPLHLAARKGHSVLCKFFIEKGADTRILDVNGRTVLHAAVESWKPETVEMILNFDPNIINIIDYFGETPFILSNSYKRVNGVKVPFNFRSIDILLKYGANPNNRRRTGVLPIQDYEYFPYKSSTLLNFGADITSESYQRSSALDKAIKELTDRKTEENMVSDEDYISIDQASSSSDDHFPPLVKTQEEDFTFYGAELIVSHANKLKAAGLGCTDRTVESLELSHKNYYDKCVREIVAMKNKKIADGLSLYSFLVAPIKGCLRTPGTEEILQMLKPFKDFPIYSSMLTDKLERASDMKHLLEVGTKFFSLLIDIKPMLTYDCIQAVLSLLDVPNLIALEKIMYPKKITYTSGVAS